ncbi:MAG TPA: TIGR03936 family radical SAM-associated protein, partial [Polyangiaceae bacterium]
LSEVRRKQDLLKQLARGIRGLELRMHDSTASVLEGIIARGDRRLGDVIERAYRGGARFDSWDEHFLPEVWDEALTHFGIDRSLMLGTIALDAKLPWSHIDVGLEAEFLPREYRKALKGRASPPCGKPVGMHIHHTNVEDANADPRKLVCYHCGIECDMTQMREERVTHLTTLGALTPSIYRGRQRRPVPNDGPGAPLSQTVAEDTSDSRPQPPLVSAESTPAIEAEPLAPAAEPMCLPGDPRSELPPLASKPTKLDESRSLGSEALKVPSGHQDQPERHRPLQLGAMSSRWRLRFEKTGPASLLGHLDLIRELPRVFRRAGLRVAYTRGFHPKPDLAFAPALSLGVASLDEYLDATLLDAPTTAQLLDSLASATSSGLKFLDAVSLPERAPSLSKSIAAAHYVVAVPTSLLSTLGSTTDVQAKFDAFMASESVVITRYLDKSQKQIDLRRFVQRATLGQPEHSEAARRAGMSGEFEPLDLVIAITPSGSAKALEVAQAVLGEAGRACRAVRVALLDVQGDPLHRRFREGCFDVGGLFEPREKSTFSQQSPA